MKKNDIFTFTAPSGVEVTAVVIDKVPCTDGVMTDTLYCYGQNRIFTYIETGGLHKYGKVIVDYAILPDYDELMQLHSSMEYPQWEQNLEAEIQGMNDK